MGRKKATTGDQPAVADAVTYWENKLSKVNGKSWNIVSTLDGY